eukprot:jgi/Chlat1/7164/Chrsp57S06746
MAVGTVVATAEIVLLVVGACKALAGMLRENKQHKYMCDRIATQVELLRSTMEGFPKPVDISVQPTLNELQGVLHNCCTSLENGMASLVALQSIESEITSCLASLSLAHMQMHARHIHRLERSLSQIDRSLSGVLAQSTQQSQQPASDARMQHVEEMLLMVTQQLQQLHAKVDASQQPLQYELTPPTFRSFESDSIEVLQLPVSDKGQSDAEDVSSVPAQEQANVLTGTEPMMMPPLSPLSIRSYSGDISMAAIPPPSPALSSTSQDSNLSGPPSSDILVEFSHAIANVASRCDARRRRGVNKLLNLVSMSVQSGNTVILESIASSEQNRKAVTMIWKQLPNQSIDCFGDFVESCASLFAILSEHLPEDAKTMFLEEASSHYWQKLSALLSAVETGRNSRIRIAAAGVLFQMCRFNDIRSMLLEKSSLIESCMRLCVSTATAEETQAAKNALTALAFPPGECGGSGDGYIRALMQLTHLGKVDARTSAIRTLSQELRKSGCDRSDVQSAAALLVQLLCGSTAASQADAVQQALCSALCLLFEADADAVLRAVEGLQNRRPLLRLIVMDAQDAVQLFAKIVERCSDATRQELCILGAIDTITAHWSLCCIDSQIWLLRGLLHLAPCNACRGPMTGISGVPCFSGLPLLLSCAHTGGAHAVDALKSIVQLAKSPSSCLHDRSFLLEGESLQVLIGLLNSNRHIDERMATAAVLVAIGEDPQAAGIGRHLQAEAVFNLLASLHPSDRDMDRSVVLQLVARLDFVDEAYLDFRPIVGLFTQAAAADADSKAKFAAVQLLKALSAHNSLCRVLVTQHLRIVLQLAWAVCRAYPCEVTQSLCLLTRSPDAALGLESCDHATINALRMLVFDMELAGNEDTSAMLLESACNLSRIPSFAVPVQLSDELLLLQALNSVHAALACAALRALLANNSALKVFAVHPEVAVSAFINVLCSAVDVGTTSDAVYCLHSCMDQRSEAVALVASSSNILQACARAYHAAISVETRRMVLSMLLTLVHHQGLSMPFANNYIPDCMRQDSGVLGLFVDAFRAEDVTACLAMRVFLKLACESDAQGMVFLRSMFNAREGGPRLLDKISAFSSSSLSQGTSAIPEQVGLAVHVLYVMTAIQNQDHGADQQANYAQRAATCNQCIIAAGGGVESLMRVLQFGVDSVYGSVDGGQLLRGILGILYSLIKVQPSVLARMRRAIIDKAEMGGLYFYVMLRLAQLLMNTPRATNDPLVGAEYVLAILHKELKDENSMLLLFAQPLLFKVLARGMGLSDDRGRCYAVDLLMQVVHVQLDSLPKNQKSAARSSIKKELQECHMQACVQKLIALSGTQSRNSGRLCSDYFDKQRVW